IIYTLSLHDALPIYTFTVVLEADDEAGGFTVHVPALPGCHTEGDTREEALAMAQDAVAAYVESLLAHNEPIPVESNPPDALSVRSEEHTSELQSRFD